MEPPGDAAADAAADAEETRKQVATLKQRLAAQYKLLKDNIDGPEGVNPCVWPST